MSVTGIGSRSTLSVQSLVDMRAQLDDLQRQLGTGKKADTYAGVGVERGLAVGLRAHVSALGAYDDAITNVGVRISLAQTSLGRLATINHDVKQTALQASTINSDGSTLRQKNAVSSLEEIFALLNTRSGDHYLFAGRASDKPAVESLDHVMNGDGTRAGFQQVLAERKQADLGANGLGRLLVSAPTATSVKVAEDAASPFGFKLASMTSTISGAVMTGPAGTPAASSINLATATPQEGQTYTLRFTLPDGTSDSVTLTATASASPGPNEFTIGATPAATAANLQTATTAAIGTLANTSLTAASAVAAGNDFFNVDASHPPQRVAGPPFDTATALVAGTSANTVSWYTGEDGSDLARATATARVDPALTVSYGVRANEQSIRSLIQNVAVLATTTYAPGDPDAAARDAALGQRVGNKLDGVAGQQTIEDIEGDLAGAQKTLAAATTRHQQTQSALEDMLQQIEGVSPDEVAAKILALQTRLQASLQATSLLYKISLVNYL
jgi:flagellin-like hook-associated protein FlgL